MKKVIATVVIIIVAALIFLPIYGKEFTVCGINPEKGCWSGKANLIQYLFNI